MSNPNHGPSITDVHGDLLRTNENADNTAYTYVREDGYLYAVGPFGKARVFVELEMVPPVCNCGWRSHEPTGTREYDRSWEVHYTNFCPNRIIFPAHNKKETA